MLRRSLLLPVLAVAAVATSASAAEPIPDGGVTLEPNVAGRPTALVVNVDPRTAESSSSELPESLAISFQRGFTFDARARPGRCSEQQAQDVACPDSSQIGNGEARGTAQTIAGPVAFTAKIEVFLANPQNGGDIADVILELREPQSGRNISARGRFTPFATGDFAAELRFNVGQQGSLPPGVTSIEVERLQLRTGAKRTVTYRVTKTVRKRIAGAQCTVKRRRRPRTFTCTVTRRRTLSLITNPITCQGEYLIRLSARYSDGRTVERDATPACTPRP